MPAKATVLMPVYNVEAYLKAAIQSVLDQPYTDFELLIINNGSTDASEEIITAFKDKRIRYVKHDSNSGLIATLNEGLEMIQSEYIIRMDADDICLPERFEKQVAFMDANPDIAISGTWFQILNSATVVKHPVTPDECKVKLLEGTVLGHPTVILRREALMEANLKFDDKALYAEDYKLWAEAASKGLQIANIPEVLLQYRVHQHQVSTQKATEQLANLRDIKLWYALQFFGDRVTSRTDVYLDLLYATINSFAFFIQARDMVAQLKLANQQHKYFDAILFNAFFDELLKKASIRIYVLCVDCSIPILMKSISDKDFYNTTTTFQKVKFVFRSIQKSLF